jgi:hypothetical protein
MCNDCEDDAIAIVRVTTRVINLLHLIDDLGLNQCELRDLSAGIHYRMEWVCEDAVEVCNET